MAQTPTFLPNSIRPTVKIRRKRQFSILPFLSILFALLISVGLSSWRIRRIDSQGCEGLPVCVAENLQSLKGSWVPTLDLDEVRRGMDHWPGIRGCEVNLKLPGTLKARAVASQVAASMQTGHGWHAISPTGEIGRHLEHPVSPVLAGIPPRQNALRRTLAAGDRLKQGLQAELIAIHWISPEDLELDMRFSPEGPRLQLRVLPEGSPVEQWCFKYLRNRKKSTWVDLRRSDRVVLRELL